jgi:hypothetical protein
MIENINSMPLFFTLLLLTDIKFSTYRKKAIDFTLAIFTISSTNLLKRSMTNNKNKTYKKEHDIRLVHNTLNIRRLELTYSQISVNTDRDCGRRNREGS